MKRIKRVFKSEIIVQKSRFIGILIPITSKEDGKNALNEVKKEYVKASHYCYGYILNGIGKSNDDGEPASTAGKPILESLMHNELNNALLIVVRYFGGIKLGAGGLTRTYVEISKKVIEVAELFEEKIVNKYELVVRYENNDILKRYLLEHQIDIIEINYLIDIEYKVSTILSNLNDLQEYMQGQIEIKYLNKEISLMPTRRN